MTKRNILIFFLVTILMCSFYGSIRNVYGYSEGQSSPQTVTWKYSVENTTGLVLGLHMDEGSGSTAYDYSIEGNNGTVYGASWVDGKIGKALSGDGIDDWVLVPNNPVFDFTVAQAISISIWIKTTYATDWHRPISRQTGNPWWGIKVNPAGDPQWMMVSSDVTSVVVPAGVAINDGVWHHIVTTYNNQVMKIYVDGFLKNQNLACGFSGHFNCGTDIRISSHQWAGEYWTGDIDEVRVYNRALNNTEITELYQQNAVLVESFNGNSQSSAYYWSFENKQDFKYDYSYAFPDEAIQKSLNCTYPKTQSFVNVSAYPYTTKLNSAYYSLQYYNSSHNIVCINEDTIALYGNNYRMFTEVVAPTFTNFIFLIIILLLQVLAMFIKIPIIHLLFGLFGMVLALTVQSEIAYPLFNIFVIFVCLISMFYLQMYRKK